MANFLQCVRVEVFCVHKYLIATRDALYIFPLSSGFYGGSQLLSLGEALEAVAENVTGGLENSKTVNRRELFFGLKKEERRDHHEGQNT